MHPARPEFTAVADSGVTPIEPGPARVYVGRTRVLLRVGAALGLLIFLALPAVLLRAPKLGLQLLWFAFIPIAPMFLLVAPNAWVSLCPISTVQSIPRRLGWKGGAHLSPSTSRRLQLVGWVLMLGGIPARHLVFNSDGPAVMAATSLVTILAFAVGLACASLSGWCAGACPIRPVEVIYGQYARDRNRPEKCTTCDGCVASCVRVHPERGGLELGASAWTTAFVHGFPGFVAAYFLLDHLGLCSAERAFFRGDVAPPVDPIAHARIVYGFMAAGFVASLLVIGALGRFGWSRGARLRAAAIAAYSCYYLGVVPEILLVWSLPPAWGWVLLAAPLLVLLLALRVPPTAMQRDTAPRASARPKESHPA